MDHLENSQAASVANPLSDADAIRYGTLLAQRLVDGEKNNFAWVYLEVVKSYYRDSDDHLPEYVDMINVVLDENNLPPVDLSADDFANVHRCAWLKLVRAVARLVDLNPFAPGAPSGQRPNPWGDPDPGPTSRGQQLRTPHGELFFGIPNASGSYSITNAQFEPSDGGPIDL